MKIFTNKKLFKKLLCVIIAITIFSAVVPTNVSYASNAAEKVGGSLLSPIASLMIGLGDVFMDLIHNVIFDMENSTMLITKKEDGWGIFLSILAAVVAIIVVAVIAYASAGAGVAILAKLGVAASITAATVGTIVTVSLGAGAVAGTLTALEWFGDNVVFPMYQISPEEIFRGEIPLLDVNFFKTEEEIDEKYAEEYEVSESGWFGKVLVTCENYAKATTVSESCKNINELIGNSNVLITIDDGCIGDWQNDWRYYQLIMDLQNATVPGSKELKDNGGHWFITNVQEKLDGLITDSGSKFREIRNRLDRTLNDCYGYYVSAYATPVMRGGESSNKLFKYSYLEFVTRINGTERVDTGEEFFGTIRIFFIMENKTVTRTEVRTYATLGKEMKPTISKWYYAIRNFVLVVMMVILLYIGIRIMLCGIASEKAKYKNMLMDWLVAICLVFIMHYIMVFAMNLVDGITDVFAAVGNGDDPFANIYEIDSKLRTKIEEELANLGKDIDEFIVKDNGTEKVNDKGNNYLYWDAKNILGMARIQAALSESGTVTYIGYGIIYLILVFFTIFFLFTYLKRALYLTFFTIIAPMVAMTYPIDKLHDGKAQAFNMWFKEYIFNLAIQPVHLLLYTVLVSSAFELSSTNMIYTLVAIGFMMPAEKFIRKMFGFDKAQTPGFLGGAAGAALMMTGLNKLFHRKPSKGGNSGGYADNGGKPDKEEKINIKDDSAVDPFLLANGSGAKQNSNNMSNVLSNQERQRQAQTEREKMEKAARLAQSYTPGTINPYVPRKTNDITPLKSDNVNNKFKQQQAEFKKAQEKAKEEAQKKAEKARQERREKLRKSFVGRHARGMWAGAKTYGRQKFKRLGMNMATGKPIRDIAKIAGGLYSGAAGALLGATVAIPGGDIKNVGQYAGTLGVAGYALGSRDIKRAQDVEMAYEEYERAQYGSEGEYREHLLEEQRKEVVENDKKQRALRTYLKLKDEKEAREKMEEYGEFIDAGIKDMEDLATAIRLVENNGWERDMAATAAIFYKKAGGKPKNMGKRDRENIEFYYGNIARANGVPEKDVKETVKIMLKNIDTFGSTKDDITRV